MTSQFIATSVLGGVGGVMEETNKRAASHMCNKFLLAKAICGVTGRARAAVGATAWTVTARWHHMVARMLLTQLTSVGPALQAHSCLGSLPQNLLGCCGCTASEIGAVGLSSPLVRVPIPAAFQSHWRRRLCPAPFSGRNPREREHLCLQHCHKCHRHGGSCQGRAVLCCALERSILRSKPQA